MPIESVCNPNVATIRANESVVDAAAQMRAEHVGDLIARRAPLIPSETSHALHRCDC
jgi:hypothetical protein